MNIGQQRDVEVVGQEEVLLQGEAGDYVGWLRAYYALQLPQGLRTVVEVLGIWEPVLK